MSTRARCRWQTGFGRWVGRVGVGYIVSALDPDPALRVTSGAVYQWLRGHVPRPECAARLVELSRGELSLETIHAHRQELHQRRAAAQPEGGQGGERPRD